MGQYLVCGRIAGNPWYIRELGIRIYTAEEFCYYIFQNTCLLEDDFITPELARFFREELEMPELADKIVRFYGSSADMPNVLVMIMRDVGYYTENQIAQFQDRLNRMRRQNPLERSRERADALLERGRCECAVQIYGGILRQPRNRRLSPRFYAQVLQHMGAAYVRMGYAEEAMECFQASYAESGDEAVLEQMYYLTLTSGMPFCEQLAAVDAKQLNAWNSRYLAAQQAAGQTAASSAEVQGIGAQPRENRETADGYIAERKRAYCHMVMNE